ncbi:MAG: hypothetical protein AB7S63_13330, partial [Thauera sp.]
MGSDSIDRSIESDPIDFSAARGGGAGGLAWLIEQVVDGDLDALRDACAVEARVADRAQQQAFEQAGEDLDHLADRRGVSSCPVLRRISPIVIASSRRQVASASRTICAMCG